MRKYVVAFCLFFTSITAFGAGYQLNLQGLRQLAMGGTGTGWIWDASTIFYNPAGLSRMKTLQFYASGLLIMPRTAFSNGQVDAVSVKQNFTPINVYLGGPVRDGSKWGLGIGFYSPAGTGLQWDGFWVGRYMVQSTQFKCFFLQPTVSYRIGQALSVGAGFVYANGSLDMQRALPVQDINGFDGELKMHGNAVGVGFNAGMHIKLGDGVQIGLTYRSQVNMEVNGGSAKFTVPQSMANLFPNTSFETQMPLPQVASFGLGLRPSEYLTIQIDLNYTGWNSYKNAFINFGTTALQNISEPRNYNNTLTPRFGLNYKISRTVSVMGGAAYDPTPVSSGYVSPDLPDANRIIVSCGASVKPFPGFTILAAFESTTSEKRASTYNFGQFNGTYQTMAVTPGIGVYYNF